MLIEYGLYLVNVLVRAFERAIGWIAGLKSSVVVTCGRRMFVEPVLDPPAWIERLLVLGKRYLEQVRTTLRYRLYFEAVTAPMRARYRALRRR